MENEVLPSSSSQDSADSGPPQPRRDSRASVSDQDSDTERDAAEETEEWEQIIWPLPPLTCTSPLLSFATVQWDVPDPTAEMSFVVADGNTDGEVSGGSSSPELPRDQGEREDGWSIDQQLLNSILLSTGSDSETCDAADVQEPTAQEKQRSPHELLLCDNEISGTESEAEEEEEESSTASDPVGTTDFAILEQSEGSEDEADGFIDLKLEEEQQEACDLLTGEEDLEEEPPSSETEDEEEELEEKTVPEPTQPEEDQEAECGNSSNQVEVPAEPEQADETPVLITEKRESQLSEREEDLEILQRSHEDPTGASGEPEMRKDIDQNVDQREAAEENGELQMEPERYGEDVENSQEVPEDGGSEEDTCQQQAPEGPESFHQLPMTDRPTREKEQGCAGSEHPPRPQPSAEAAALAAEAARPENADLPDRRAADERMEEEVERRQQQQREQTEPPEQKEQTSRSSQAAGPEQPEQPRETDEPQITEQLPAESDATRQTAGAGSCQDKLTASSRQVRDPGGSEGGREEAVPANGERAKPAEAAGPHANGREVDGEMARRLAERLFNLDGFQRVDVVKHLDKDNDFSRTVGEEYLKFFDFAGQTLDGALRSFLKVVVLIGETQERERVLQHFSCRFHQCNPDAFSSSGAVLALTCALMLLNTDLHGQNVGKSMSSSKFVSNLDGMNEGKNFSKDLLKSLYNSIKGDPLEWAVGEGELMSSVFVDGNGEGNDAPLRSKANPFQDVPHDKKAYEVKEGMLQRKLHADIDGKRIPWGKRGWKTFHGVLKGMVLYFQKVDYRRDQTVNEEVVSVHHSLAEPAVDYTKKPHVFRLQTADWRVFLFQASCKVEMNSWINRINLVSALQSSPPFPAAVGSQRRFFRPILPALQSAHTLDRQLQSHSGMLESFRADISYLQENLPERKKAKAKELEEHRVRAEYLQYEIRRYEVYIQVLEAWKSVKKTDAVDGEEVLDINNLNLFDRAACADAVGEEDEEEGLKKSHSSPALQELLPQTVKVKRNISERRTYRRVIVPRRNKEA